MIDEAIFDCAETVYCPIPLCNWSVTDAQRRAKCVCLSDPSSTNTRAGASATRRQVWGGAGLEHEDRAIESDFTSKRLTATPCSTTRPQRPIVTSSHF
jgi:hypothetical protein